MRWAVMLVGAAGAGKTTLLRALQGSAAGARKTQAATFSEWIIDTPGEYAQHRAYYHALVSLAADAAAIWVVQDATADRPTVWPELVRLIRRPALGVITKADHPRARPQRAEQLLALAGVHGPYVHTSARTGAGIDRLGAEIRLWAGRLQGEGVKE